MLNDGFLVVFGSQFSHLYIVNYLIGVATLVIFAWQSLTRPSFALSDQDGELLDRVKLSLVSGVGRFIKAWVLYTPLLLVAYTVLCYMGPSILHLILSDPTGLPAGAGKAQADDSAPLLMSMAIVGLGQTTPYITKVEALFRRVAHQFIGVPDNILDLRRQVAETPIEEGALTADERKEITRALEIDLRSHAFLKEQDIEHLEHCLKKFYLLRHWLFTTLPRGAWPSPDLKRRLSAVEPQVLRSIRNCDNLISLLSGEVLVRPVTRQEQERLLWDQLADQLVEAIDAMSLLLALYTVNEPRGPRSSRHRQLQSMVLALTQAAKINIADITLIPMLGMALAVLLFSTLTFLSLGIAEGGGELHTSTIYFAISRASFYTFMAIVIYLPGALTGMMIWEYLDGRKRWATPPGWLPNATRFASIFVASWTSSALALIVVKLTIRIAGTNDTGREIEQFFSLTPFIVTLVFALIGGVIGTLTIYILHHSSQQGSRASSTKEVKKSITGAGLVIALICFFGFVIDKGGSLNAQNFADIALAFGVANVYGFTGYFSMQKYLRQLSSRPHLVSGQNRHA